MRRIKLELCYDGANYAGWQIQPKQPNVKTIQGELEKAVSRVVCEQVEVLGSGRTDSGVHALCQTAAFVTNSNLTTESLTRAINAFLPRDIRVWRSSEVALDFHPIRDVVRKRYRYLASDARPAFPFFRRYAWSLLQRVDVELMNAACWFLLGEHDFRAFQTQGSPRKTTVREVYDARVERLPLADAFRFPKLSRQSAAVSTLDSPSSNALPFFDELEMVSFEIEANGFLYNMVRAIFGTLYLFGQRRKGFEDPSLMREIIERADRKYAGPTAPAHGLYMIDAVYPDEESLSIG